jgi:hypothetical protein
LKFLGVICCLLSVLCHLAVSPITIHSSLFVSVALQVRGSEASTFWPPRAS